MIEPTLTNARIVSKADALKILTAAYWGMLNPITTSRLTEVESQAIKSGDLFVWEERHPDEMIHGVSRFVDGRQWSRSGWRVGVRTRFLSMNHV